MLFASLIKLAKYLIECRLITTSLRKELIRNGFKEVADDDFIKLVGLPEAIKDLGGETQPVYSSEEFWIT